MTKSKQTEPASSPSDERVAIVRWAARHGAITAEALCERSGSSVASARSKLAAAERGGLLIRANPLAHPPALYTATRAGLRAAAAISLGPCRVSASNAAHLACSARVAAVLERRYPDHAVMSERELRRAEHDRRLPLVSARLRAGGTRERCWHRPDLVLWPSDADAGGLPVAVEVELTVKAPRRLEAICRAWARARWVGGVLYMAAPTVETVLARAIARAQAQERIVVLPLAAVIGACGPAARAEPSAGGRERTIPSCAYGA